MNALRNLGMTGLEYGKSVTRLSTGLRINSAADDPAGLIGSETFRAQITGIDQALKNSQDAVNYAKTAEGAMDEMNKLLRDARALAVQSANSATLTEAQKQANQNQLNSIVASITRISQNTSFGGKKLLDGSAGTYAASISAANVSSMSFSGIFNGNSISQASTVTVDMTTAATRASVTGTRLFTNATDTVQAGSFTINGVTFSTASSDTILDVVARINNSSDQTGVTATWTAGGSGVVLRNKNYGSDAKVELIDSNAILRTAAGAQSSTGVDAIADVVINTSSGLVTVSFNAGKGLTLRDKYGNTVQLTENGNLDTTAGGAAWGQVYVGSSNFQIGGNAGETTQLSLSNMAASNLGTGVVSGKNLSNLDLTTASGATDALSVIDKAINDVSESRGRIGNFSRNVVESNIRSLAVSRENLSATESSIRDVDVAEEMTNFTKIQILQQSGMAILAQANSAPQSVLSLLRG
ncbi:MAG: Flagellin [Fimbriimonadaceae bacterium]|nr:Flagellin [Fimbriimonadaceae bacterium]